MTKIGNRAGNAGHAYLPVHEDRQGIGERLREARSSLGLNQAQFSVLIGASKRGVQDNEAGKTVPGGAALAAMAQLGIDIHWVLTSERRAIEAHPSQDFGGLSGDLGPGESVSANEWLSIGARLKSMRGSRSQAEMASFFGVHPNTYARWERGEREIGASCLAIAAKERWNINWLLTGEGEKVQAREVFIDPTSGVSHTLRPDVFKLAVETVDSELQAANRVLPVGLRAEAYSLVYEIFMDDHELTENGVHDMNPQIVRAAIRGLLRTT